MSGKRSGEFVKQAGILAAAGIIVRLIGILYRSPLVAVIGDEGNGYYNTAYNIYTIILLVSSYSIPSAISKVIAARLAVKEYENAHRIFTCSFYYVIIAGGLGSLLCFFGAEWLVGENSAVVLRVFAPTIFLSGILGVFRGYFQAHRSMTQTSLSQILEQILNAVVSILAALLFMNLVANADTTTKAIYGAMGSAVGTGSGVLIALLFMWLVYRLNSKGFKKRRAFDKKENLLGYGAIFKIIFAMVTPVILSTFIYNLNTTINLKVYQEIMQNVNGFTEEAATTAYGLFSGKAMQIINIPIALASAMSAAIIPSIAGTFERKEKKETQKRVARAIQVTMLISIPCAVGLFVLAKPVVLLLYPQKASVDMVAALIRVLSVGVVLYGLSTLTNAVLQGTGKVNAPVWHAGIALMIQTAVLVGLLLGTNLDLYSMCIATLVYAFIVCLLNAFSVRRHLDYKQEVLKTFVLPCVAAFWMGLFCFATYFGMSMLIRLVTGDSSMEITGMWNVLCILVALPISAIVYFALVMKLGAVGENELKDLPMGGKLVRVGRKLRLLREK